MQHLTPVGLSKDGKQLVLISDTGEEFAVPVDTRLRAALRGDHARLGQLEMKMESALRPRDIQARIRGGESAEDVAAAAQTTVDAIMGFAAPVLAERAHVAESAQKSSIRRRSTDATTAAGTLDQAARTHLSDVGVRVDDVDWDAWRRDDGRWTLVAEYVMGGSTRRAEFIYDQPGRYVVADNQEARLLTGEASRSAEPGTSTRRLSSVPSETGRSDDELPLADHEPADHELADHELDPDELDPDELDPDELGSDAIKLVRGDDELTADHGDADWIADTNEPVEDPAPADEATDHDADDEADDAPAADATPAKPHKKGRSSVPSWDEIMFGGGKVE